MFPNFETILYTDNLKSTILKTILHRSEYFLIRLDYPGPSNICTFSSPKKKRSKRTVMRSVDKKTLINVYKHVEETWPKDSYPYKYDIANKTAEIMGISRSSVFKILCERKEKGRVGSPTPRWKTRSIIDNLDDLQLGAIRRKIHTFYFNKELPTIDKVLEAVNTDDTLPDFKRTTFYKIFQKLQMKYVKRSRNSALLDRDDIVRWRIKYLHEIVRMRAEGRKIYYTDETWLNEGHTMSKVWQDQTIMSVKEAHREGLSMGLKNPSGKGKRLIILHIGSDTGFLEGGDLIFEAKKTEGDYHSEMDSYNYEKWFTKILPILEPNSVVVIDNAPYHSRRKEKVPTMANKKDEIQKWLLEKNIPFDHSEVKAQLIENIKKEKDKYQSYIIDDMAQENGITVVRLPPYHCELNPIELIWAQVKGYVARHNKSFKLNEVKILLADAIKSITAENWKKCIDHVIKEEQKMLKIDGIIDDVVDHFIIHVGDSESSDTDLDSE